MAHHMRSLLAALCLACLLLAAQGEQMDGYGCLLRG
jgi:hypothetical protein